MTFRALTLHPPLDGVARIFFFTFSSAKEALEQNFIVSGSISFTNTLITRYLTEEVAPTLVEEATYAHYHITSF